MTGRLTGRRIERIGCDPGNRRYKNPPPLSILFPLLLAGIAGPLAGASPLADHAARSQLPAVAENPAARPTPRHETWLHAHEKREVRLREGRVDVLLVGDSITAGWSKQPGLIKTHFPGREVVNLGHPADKTENILWRLRHHSFDGIKPGLAIVLAGTNNSNGDEYTDEQVAGGVKTIVAELRARLPETKILLLGIFPRGSVEQRRELKRGRTAAGPNPQWERIDRINQLLSTFADGRNVVYRNLNRQFLNEQGELTTEVMPDFLHPSSRGYEIWARALQPILAEVFPAPRTSG